MKRTNPIIRNIAIILVSSMLAAFYIITGNASREYPSIENLQRQISQINDQVEIVSQKADLPLLPNIWHSITVIASLPPQTSQRCGHSRLRYTWRNTLVWRDSGKQQKCGNGSDRDSESGSCNFWCCSHRQ